MNLPYPTKTNQFANSIVPLPTKSGINFLSSCNNCLLSTHDNGEVHVWKYIPCKHDWILPETNSNICLQHIRPLRISSTDAASNSKVGSVLSITGWERQERNFVINATSTGIVTFWDNQEFNGPTSLLHKGKAHGSLINVVTVWNEWLVTASSDNTIKVWNMELSNTSNDNSKLPSIQIVKLVKLLAGHSGSIYAAIAVDKHLWTGGRDRTIRIWSQGFRTVEVVQAHKGTITSLCEWRLHVASGSYDKTIKIWNKEGKLVKNFLGHQSWVTCLCVWKDRLCSGSKDRTIRIWSWNGDCISVISEEDQVKSLHVWKEVLWSSGGQAIRCWQAKVSWNVLRVLWIGQMRNSPWDCALARLPSEILKEIISALVS